MCVAREALVKDHDFFVMPWLYGFKQHLHTKNDGQDGGCIFVLLYLVITLGGCIHDYDR